MLERKFPENIIVFITVFLMLLVQMYIIQGEDEVTKQFYRSRLELTRVPTDIPCEVREVYLHFNQIVNISSDIWNCLSSLVVLVLRENEIKALPSDAFSSLTRLRTLDWSQN